MSGEHVYLYTEERWAHLFVWTMVEAIVYLYVLAHLGYACMWVLTKLGDWFMGPEDEQ